MEGSGRPAARNVPGVHIQARRADSRVPPTIGNPPATAQPAGSAFAVLLMGRAGHPHVHAFRPAVHDGHADRARAEGFRFRRAQGSGTGTRDETCAEDGEERLSGRARHAFRPVPRLRRSQVDPAMGDEHRTGGDKPAVGAVLRPDRPRMGRTARRSAHPHHLRRPALVRFARLGRGEREGAPVRPADRAGPHRAMGAHQPARGTRLPHPPRPGGRRHPATVPLRRFRHAEPRHPRRRGRRREPHPPGGADRRRRGPVRLLQRHHPQHRHQRGRPGKMVEDKARRAARPAGFRPGQGGTPRRLRFGVLGRLSRPLAYARHRRLPHRPKVELHLRSARPERRRHRARAVEGAVAADPGTVHMERAGTAGRAHHRHDQIIAENPARTVRTRPGHGTQDPRLDRRTIPRPTRLRKPAKTKPGPRKRGWRRHMARPATRVHPSGHQHRRRANPPGSPHRRTMEQARTIPAHDLRRGTAAATQPQEPARQTARARPRQNTRHRQITRRTATRIRRTSQSLRTSHGRKTSPKRRRPRQVRRTSQPAQQSGSDHRSTRHHALARRARHAAPAR